MEEKWITLERNHNYAVSNLGRVMRIAGGPAARAGRILKNYFDQEGYSRTRLGKYGGVHFIHKLVYESFYGDIKPNTECHHINGNKEDNHPENLEYISHKENILKSKAMGRRCRGENQHFSKLKEKDIPIIRNLLKAKISKTMIAKQYNVSRPAIRQVQIGISWAWLK